MHTADMIQLNICCIGNQTLLCSSWTGALTTITIFNTGWCVFLTPASHRKREITSMHRHLDARSTESNRTARMVHKMNNVRIMQVAESSQQLLVFHSFISSDHQVLCIANAPVGRHVTPSADNHFKKVKNHHVMRIGFRFIRCSSTISWQRRNTHPYPRGRWHRMPNNADCRCTMHCYRDNIMYESTDGTTRCLSFKPKHEK
jgi:hypothetical protein